MTTIKDEYDNFKSKCGDAGDKVIGFALITSNLNILREGVEELQDDEISKAFEKLIKLFNKKSEELFESEIKLI